MCTKTPEQIKAEKDIKEQYKANESWFPEKWPIHKEVIDTKSPIKEILEKANTSEWC